MKEDKKVLKILFNDEDTKLLSTVLKYLEVYLDFAGYKKVIFMIPKYYEQIEEYNRKHHFFSYKIADSQYLKKQMERRVVFPRKNVLIMTTGTRYGNNILELVGRNDFTLDDAVLVGLYGLPEIWLAEHGLIQRGIG